MTSSDTVLTISDRFTIEIIAEGGAVLAIERNLPDAFKDVMDLR
jgi:archaellin